MKTIAELVAHYERRMTEIDGEIARLEQTPDSPNISNEVIDGWIVGWQEDRAICRDTISYLKTLERREVSA